MDKILHEILMDLALAASGNIHGNDSDLSRFLDLTIPLFREKLECADAGIIEDSGQEMRVVWPGQISPGPPAFPGLDMKAIRDLHWPMPDGGPQMFEAGLFFYIFPLTGTGFLILARNKRFDGDMPRLLLPVTSILGKTCLAIEEVKSLRNAVSEFEQALETKQDIDNNPAFEQTKALNGIRVLLVEDNKFNQFVVRSMLEKWTAITDVCEDGQMALDKLRTGSFDLILMDLQMPVMDGITASIKIRQELKLQTPIIALTANVVKGIQDRCEQAGMQGYISKPFEEEDLFEKIVSVLNIVKTGNDISVAEVVRVDLCDVSRLVKMVGNDPGMLKKMIERFLEVTPEYISDLSQAAANRDVDAIERTSHRIKSAIDLVSNDIMRNLIKSINDIGKKGIQNDELYLQVKLFLEYFTFLSDQLKVYIKAK